MNHRYKDRIEFINDAESYFSYRRLLSYLRPMKIHGYGMERVGDRNYGGHVMANVGCSGIVISIGDDYNTWAMQIAERGFTVQHFTTFLTK